MEEKINILDHKPEVKLTPDIAKYFVGRQIEAYQVSGDCLEWKRITDKSILFFDLEMRPSIGEVTMCRLDGCPDLLAKMFIAPKLGQPGTYIVRTCYKDQKQDKSLLVKSVQGVAVACFDKDGSLIWRRPTPEEMKNYVSINTWEGWNRACKESVARTLREKGIEPTEENIAQYQKEQSQKTEKMIDEWLAQQKEKQAA